MNHSKKVLQRARRESKQEDFERLMVITERIASAAIAVSFFLLTVACLATL